MTTRSVYREFPEQLVVEKTVTSDLEIRCRDLVAVWDQKHNGLLVNRLTLNMKAGRHTLHYGFLPDLSDEAVMDFKAALEPLLGELTFKPVTYNPDDFVSIPVYDLGKPPKL